ncbi:hypothetical protein EM595_1725 [Duffyella gerundensis]|uniref:Uncharacterized protein n=1 Tax=Duffyella gerundensis TaxID=1619313 RepID=A0A0U5L669_9GAMM|nr:hypothetical protein EM595_1725 [Duffyella gerundensis]
MLSYYLKNSLFGAGKFGLAEDALYTQPLLLSV